MPALGKLLRPSSAIGDRLAPSASPCCSPHVLPTCYRGDNSEGSRAASGSNTETPLNGEFTLPVWFHVSKLTKSTNTPERSSIDKAFAHTLGQLSSWKRPLIKSSTAGQPWWPVWDNRWPHELLAAKHTLKLSAGHEPSLSEKPQPWHRKTSGIQHPGRSEVILSHQPHLPVTRFCHL